MALAALILSCGTIRATAFDQATTDQHIQIAQQELQNGNWAKSLARFRWLLLEGLPDAQHEVAYQNTIATITNQHPLRFSLSGTLLPSSNISKASSHSIFATDLGDFTIDSAEDHQSGLGLQLGTSATFSRVYARGRTIYATGSLSTNLYGEKDLQVAQGALTIGHEWLSAGRQSRLSLTHNHYAYRDLEDRDAPDFVTTALSFSRYQKLGAKSSLRIDANIQSAAYEERDHNDGVHTSLYLTPKYQLNVQNAVSAKFGAQTVDIQADHLSYTGHSLGVFWDRIEKNGMRWGLGVERHWRDFDSVFPALSFARFDQVTDLVLTASHPRIKIKEMTPTLRCTLRDHGSNVALYDYNSTDCRVSLSFHF